MRHEGYRPLVIVPPRHIPMPILHNIAGTTTPKEITSPPTTLMLSTASIRAGPAPNTTTPPTASPARPSNQPSDVLIPAPSTSLPLPDSHTSLSRPTTATSTTRKFRIASYCSTVSNFPHEVCCGCSGRTLSCSPRFLIAPRRGHSSNHFSPEFSFPV